MNVSNKFDSIFVAKRDGIKEYELFDLELSRLKEKRSKYKINKKLDKNIELTIKARKLLPKYEAVECPSRKSFKSYLINTGYKTSIDKLKNSYLVFDIETNGIRKLSDDLLSLSIYDPTSGVCYNRYFPLDLQPLILTTFINGITDKTLEDAIHMDQEEVNTLIEYFHMKERILLSYSGGKGNFDYKFILNYCNRHKLTGFENLIYENIKSLMPIAPFGFEGQLSKDNLCKILNIEGVQEIHSSYNDCLLEWKLFEKLKNEKLFLINQHIYRYHKGYIVPVSYLNKYPKLIEFADIKVPYLTGEATLVYDYSIPKKTLKYIQKFSTNITGFHWKMALLQN